VALKRLRFPMLLRVTGRVSELLARDFGFGGECGVSVAGCLDSLHSGHASALHIQGWHGSLELLTVLALFRVAACGLSVPMSLHGHGLRWFGS
jgi:hypothetical protein